MAKAKKADATAAPAAAADGETAADAAGITTNLFVGIPSLNTADIFKNIFKFITSYYRISLIETFGITFLYK